MVIGLAGHKQAGKDTTAEYLKQRYGFTRIAFASKLKQAGAVLFGTTPDIWEIAKVDKSFQIALIQNGQVIKSVTARQFLQNMGQKYRELFGDSFWIDELLPTGVEYNPSLANGNIVVSDVRYPNEAKRVREYGGKIIELRRIQNYEPDDHDSETPLPRDMVDHLLVNNGTRAELYKQIERLMRAYDYTPSS